VSQVLSREQQDRVRAELHRITAEFGSPELAADALGLGHRPVAATLAGATVPTWLLAERIADYRGVTLDALLAGQPIGQRYRDLPGWEDAVCDAVRRWPSLGPVVPVVEAWPVSLIPARVDAALVSILTSIWLERVSSLL
jgi:hypothetical protein